MAAGEIEPEAPPERTFYERMLDGIERVGNRVPHPAMIFVGLIVIVIAASQILYWFDVNPPTRSPRRRRSRSRSVTTGDRSTPRTTCRASSSRPPSTRSTRRPRESRAS
jgi:hypothetical protein